MIGQSPIFILKIQTYNIRQIMEILRILIILNMLYRSLTLECYDMYQGETYDRPTSSYCLPIIKWPISESSLLFSTQYDTQAYNNYHKLYTSYYKEQSVSLDCLGISKYFFCADAYPTCNSTIENPIQDINKICRWMCDLFAVRCGQTNQFYMSICKEDKIADQYCSFEGLQTLFYSLAVLYFLLF